MVNYNIRFFFWDTLQISGYCILTFGYYILLTHDVRGDHGFNMLWGRGVHSITYTYIIYYHYMVIHTIYYHYIQYIHTCMGTYTYMGYTVQVQRYIPLHPIFGTLFHFGYRIPIILQFPFSHRHKTGAGHGPVWGVWADELGAKGTCPVGHHWTHRRWETVAGIGKERCWTRGKCIRIGAIWIYRL